ncbi:MAG: DUF3866 family protein [Dethiobacter sp.]|jgi:hypothetical protein|nr:DUF3866 family protein [Dethiobacter sp.]
MFSLRVAEVIKVDSLSQQCEELLVKLGKDTARAINYVALTGTASPGERVVLNTTAVELGLGSGGYHFVYLNLAKIERSISGDGHLMKLRYTPSQIRTLSVEEEASPHHLKLKEAVSLEGLVVIAAELHSMLAPAVVTLKQEKPSARVVYLMTDGGALPACFSNTIRNLRQSGLLEAVITSGHSFGGDLEAVNVYSGLLAARHVLKADVAVACMGPGVAGTSTAFGFSGIEMGENINRIHALEGSAVALPRLSFSDARARHRGLSHHTLTALNRVALAAADLPLPVLPPEQDSILKDQLQSAGLCVRHRVVWLDNLSLRHLADSGIDFSTMGRTLYQDEAFYLAAVAAARHAAAMLC